MAILRRIRRRDLMMGQVIPTWWRIAHEDVMRNCAVIAPIGLHLLVRWHRRIWEWTFRYNPSKMENLLMDAYCRGVDNNQRLNREFERCPAYREWREAKEAAEEARAREFIVRLIKGST